MVKPISAMPWHDDGLKVLVVGDDGSVWLWSYATGEWEWLSDMPDSPAYHGYSDAVPPKPGTTYKQ